MADATMLPPLYQGWVTDVLDGPLPTERRATCHACVMCKGPNGEVPAAAYTFDPRIKCCNYTPFLPNFLVGRILADEGLPVEVGRTALRERIARGVGVSPLGVGRTPGNEAMHKASVSAHGRAVSLKCPYYVDTDGSCGIWKHRNGVCTTWFCKHERGTVGREFWTAIRELLTAIEQALARWCLLELDFDVARVPTTHMRPGEPEAGTLDVNALDGQADPVAQAFLWGAWAGREEAFYERCAALVADLSWADIQRIAGPDVALFAKSARQVYATLSDDSVPGRLRLGQLSVLAMGADGAYVVTDSPFDPVGVPALLLTALHYFDGGPTEEAFLALSEERGLALDQTLLRAMLDYRVLMGVPG